MKRIDGDGSAKKAKSNVGFSATSWPLGRFPVQCAFSMAESQPSNSGLESFSRFPSLEMHLPLNRISTQPVPAGYCVAAPVKDRLARYYPSPAAALLALGILVFAFLAPSMPASPCGWRECLNTRRSSAQCWACVTRLPCALHVGSFQLPLAVAPYVDGGFIYLHAPFVAAWFHGVVGDPYFYRFVGILAFLLDGWLIFFVASRAWNRRAGMWAGALWFTTPDLLLISIADLQFELIPLVFLLGASAFTLQFMRGGRIRHLLAAAFCWV